MLLKIRAKRDRAYLYTPACSHWIGWKWESLRSRGSHGNGNGNVGENGMGMEMNVI